MTELDILALLLTLAALLAWLNHRFLRLPSTIGLMALALAASLSLLVLDSLGILGGLHARVAHLLQGLDFPALLLHGALGVLLFAGALHVDLGALRREWLPVSALALVGTVVSTFAVAVLAHYGFRLVGHDLGFLDALVLGALISPTDPIAVLGIIQRAGVPKELELQISGESMFNDGVGVVIFTLVVGVMTSGAEATAGSVALLFAREALGGALLGLVTGWVAFLMLRAVDEYAVEVLITLALVIGGYALGEALHVSAPIGAVVAGLFIGNRGRRLAMSDKTRDYLDAFWELVDEILNSMLFVVIGLEVLVIRLGGDHIIAGLLLVAITLLSRFATSVLLVGSLHRRVKWAPHAPLLLTWGGLRGGISVALALSLPVGSHRDLIVAATYVVVAFSILVQGTTLGPLLRRLGRRGAAST